jgi:para-nitrobenzyl esterase
MSPAQRTLADQMIAYWTRFAHTGDPNGPGRPRWARFTPTGSRVLALAPGQAGIRPVDVSAEHQCGFWNTVDFSSR